LCGAVEASIDSIVIADLEGKIIDVNEATLNMYGTNDIATFIGKSFLDFIDKEDRERALAGMIETLEKGYVKNRDYHIITKNGDRIPVEINATILKDLEEKPIGFAAITRDITERKKAEEALLGSC
jgi:PAS domain S-box-containing protein